MSSIDVLIPLIAGIILIALPQSLLQKATSVEVAAKYKNKLQNHPPSFEKKVLGWRFGPATRQG